MSVAVQIILCLVAGFCAGLAGAYWWLGGFHQELSDRLRTLEKEVNDNTREHWIEGVQAGEHDWNWPGRNY